MPVKKLSIALHPDVAADVARSAKLQELTVSAWLEQAARRALRREDGLAAVDDYEREHGPFTAEEIAWADRVIDEDFGPGFGREDS